MKTTDQWLDELSKGTTQAFPNVVRSEVVSGLRDRLDHPEWIDQANTSLCGCASLMYAMASNKPELYAQYVVEMFHTGQSKIGSLDIKPGDSCKKYKPLKGNNEINAIDWITLASLRDSENDAFDYDSPSVEAGGITMPGDLADWFKAVGFKQDTNVTNLVFTKGLGDLIDAGRKFQHGQWVCLFIDANMIESPNSTTVFPNHWVVMDSEVKITQSRPAPTNHGLFPTPRLPTSAEDPGKTYVTFSVFTWGGYRDIHLSSDTVCSHFYGYVSSSGGA